VNSIALSAESRTLVSLLLALYVNFRVCPVGSVALVRSSPVYCRVVWLLFLSVMFISLPSEEYVYLVWSLKVRVYVLLSLAFSFSQQPGAER